MIFFHLSPTVNNEKNEMIAVSQHLPVVELLLYTKHSANPFTCMTLFPSHYNPVQCVLCEDGGSETLRDLPRIIQPESGRN